MTDLSTARARIAEIDKRLAEGLSSQTHADRAETRDLAEMRRERDRLARMVAASSRSRFTRVTFVSRG